MSRDDKKKKGRDGRRAKQGNYITGRIRKNMQRMK